jgi:NhaP-type Na+/H+ or K+/H+ antiporter
MAYQSIAYIGVVSIGYALLSRRLARSPITGPMYFTAAGFLGATLGVWEPLLQAFGVSALLEVTLGLVLFTGAMKLRLISWSEDFELASRLLAIGMPLTILFGAIAAAVILPGVELIGGAIIATVLAPTDAALGLAVVENPRVPKRIREALEVESGLNDGIALPVLLFFLALAFAEEGEPLWSLVLEGVGVAVVVGVIFGGVAGWVMRDAVRRGWMQERWQQIMVVIVPIMALVVADELGGSGFIATFVAGLVFGRLIQGMGESVADFADDSGTVLTMFAFALFGGIFLAENLDAFSAATIVYAVLSLTVVRMLAVSIAMMRSDLAAPTTLFMGWFGPRGLASIIFAAIVVEDVGLTLGAPVVAVMIVTVTLSIFLHGVTAYHGSEAYADWYQKQ